MTISAHPPKPPSFPPLDGAVDLHVRYQEVVRAIIIKQSNLVSIGARNCSLFPRLSQAVQTALASPSLTHLNSIIAFPLEISTPAVEQRA
ncbi:hypothetical protein VMCG_04641 [Cytospora schulzeri]|uniref:Uncharacterized protein n=1 Tax=Cytospora schulzeri TaxID=448051 RepID=A0A423WRH5_9PEZI|nr:hypothetical protein VMCG_04641 [Valsa malicola]